MSITINAPTDQVTTYDVAGQSDVQLNFDFDPTLFRTDGTTLVIEYEGHEIRLENFFNADGTSGVENFVTQDGQAFSAADLLAAVMGGEPGTGEDIETAAGNAGGSSGAGEYDDNPGNLYDGLDAVGDQPDAYAHEPMEFLNGDDFDLENDGGTTRYYSQDEYWRRYDPDDVGYDPDGSGLDFTVVLANKGSAGVDAEPLESVALYGQNRTFTEYNGTDGVVDTLILTDDPWGDVLRLEDDFSYPDAGPHLDSIEVIHAGAGDDVVDLSSNFFTYDDVTVYGDSGNDVIWTNSGNDTVYGGSGEDSIIGGTGDDVIYGGADADRIFGGTGDDILNGGTGDDYIFGGTGNDTISLGTGDDKVNAETGYHDVVDLGGGADSVIINSLSVTDGADTAVWDNSDGVDTGTSAVEVTGFGIDDSLDLAPGYSVLDAQIGDFNNDGQSDIGIFVGESTTTNNTWVVLSDTAYDTSTMSSEMISMLQAYLGAP